MREAQVVKIIIAWVDEGVSVNVEAERKAECVKEAKRHSEAFFNVQKHLLLLLLLLLFRYVLLTLSRFHQHRLHCAK
jgi:hypothetical protein